MRILYVVTAAKFGGAPMHVIRLAEADIKRGHTVGVVSAPEPRLLSELKRIGAQTFSNPYFVRPVQPCKDVRALWLVFQVIRKFKPDLVSAHSTKAGYAARFACAILRKPVIFTAHGWAFTEGRSAWKRRFLALAERLAGRVTAKTICVSNHDRDLALKFKVMPPGKLLVIHNGVDPAPFLNATGACVRQEFGLGETPVLTMVGRLAPPKDPLVLLEASQLLRGEFKLLIIGDGELRSAAENFIRKSRLNHTVILAGERKDIPEILAASDIFVLPSRWEGLPYTIIEAMMAGLPVVATSVGGVPELVDDWKTGVLVPPENPEALAETLQKLLDDPDLCKRMGQAGRKKALREFTLDRMLAETQRVYEEVLKSRVSQRGQRG